MSDYIYNNKGEKNYGIMQDDRDIMFKSDIFSNGEKCDVNINKKIVYVEGCCENNVKIIIEFLSNSRFGGPIDKYSLDNNANFLKVEFNQIDGAIKALKRGEIKITKNKSLKIVKNISEVDRTIYVYNVEEEDIIVALIEAQIGEIDLKKAHYDSNTKIFKIVLNNLEDTEKILNLNPLEIDTNYFCDISRSLLMNQYSSPTTNEHVSDINECKSDKEPYILYISGIESNKILTNILLFVKNVSSEYERYEFVENKKLLKIFYKNQIAAKNLHDLHTIELGMGCVYTITDKMNEYIAKESFNSEIMNFKNNNDTSTKTIYIKKISDEKYFEAIKPIIESAEIGGKIESYEFDKIKESVKVILFKEEDAIKLINLKYLEVGHNIVYTITKSSDSDDAIIDKHSLYLYNIPFEIKYKSLYISLKDLHVKKNIDFELHYMEGSGIAKVTYNSIEDCDYLLKKEEFFINDKSIMITRKNFKIALDNYISKNQCFLKFTNIPDYISPIKLYKYLLFRYESLKHWFFDIKTHTAFVELETLNDVNISFVENKFLIDNEVIDYEVISYEFKYGHNSNLIKFSGIPKVLNMQLFIAMIENKRYGGGDILSYEFINDSESCLVIYVEQEIANDLLNKGELSYKGNKIIISKYEIGIKIYLPNIDSYAIFDKLRLQLENYGTIEIFDYIVKSKTACIVYENSELAQEKFSEEIFVKEYNKIIFSNVENILYKTHQENVLTNYKEEQYQNTFTTISVEHVPPSCNRHFLQLYFEAPKNNGGPLAYFDYDSSNGICILVFQNEKDADALLKREHFLKGNLLKLFPLEYPYRKNDVLTMVIIDSLKNISEEHMKLFMESKTNSNIEVYRDIDKDYTYITFENTTAIDKIKNDHLVISGKSLNLNLMEPAPPPRLILTDVDDLVFIAQHLPQNIKFEEYKIFIDKATESAQLIKWQQLNNLTEALLFYNHPPKFSKMRKLVATKAIKGKMTSIGRMQRSKQICFSIEQNYDEEYLVLTIEAITGDKTITNIQIINRNLVIVTFINFNCVNKLLSVSIAYNKQDLHVQVYYEEFSLKLFKNLHTTAHIKYDNKKMEKFLKYQLFKNYIEHQMKFHDAEVIWPNTKDNNLYLKYCKETDDRKDIENWKLLIQNIFDEYMVYELTIIKEIWDDLLKKTVQIFKDYLKDIVFEPINDRNVILVLGTQKIADEVHDFVRKLSEKLIDDLNKIEKILKFEEHQLELIEILIPDTKILLSYPDVIIAFNKSDKCISIYGSSNDVNSLSINIYEYIQQCEEKFFSTSPIICSLLKLPIAKEYFYKIINDAGIKASIKIREPDIVVYFNESDINLIQDIFNGSFIERSITVDPIIFSNSKWQLFVESLVKDFEILLMDINSNNLKFACTASEESKILERIKGFIDYNTQLENFIPIDNGYLHVFRNYLQNEFTLIFEKHKTEGGDYTIECNNQNPGIRLFGHQSLLKITIEEINKSINKILSESRSMERPGIGKYIEENIGKSLRSCVEHKHKVVIEIGQDSDEIKQQPIEDMIKIYEFVLPNGVSISVFKGDITKCKVDAIVNAANETLSHDGGVARAIIEAAGKAMQTECKNYIADYGAILKGNCYVSKSYNIKQCKCIIHAVGPRWFDGTKEEDKFLGSAIYNSLIKANENSCNSIAFPAISSSIFGYPVNFAAQVIVTTIFSYLDGNKTTRIRDVQLVDLNDDAISCFQQTLDAIKNQRQPKPELIVDSGRKHGDNLDSLHTETQNISTSSSNISLYTQIPQGLVTSTGLKIKIETTPILDLQVDILVNSINSDCDLSKGIVSKLVSETAGPQLQAECLANKPANFSFGNMIITRGFNLKCRYIYHVSLQSYDNSNPSISEKCLKNIVEKILVEADKNSLNSIAFPALGTGNLRIPTSIVARILFDEILKYSKEHQNSSINNIIFAIYKDNDSVLKEFNNMLNINLGIIKQTSLPNSGSQQDFDPRKFKINNIEIVMEEGDITDAQVDAIVNSTNIQMNGGAVAKVIKIKGGSVLNNEIKQAVMGQNNICITGAGNLKAKYILHFVAGKTDWKTNIANILNEAENLKINSIAFPLLGTGSLKESGKDMSTVMLNSFEKFCKKTDVIYLKKIFVIIYQKDLTSMFINCVNSKFGPSLMKKAFNMVNSILFPEASGATGGGDSLSEHIINSPSRHQKKIIRSPLINNPNKVVLDVYGLEANAIKEAIAELSELLNENIIDKVYDNERDRKIIEKLNNHQIEQIEKIAKKHCIHLEIDKNLNRMRMRGFSQNMVLVQDEIANIYNMVTKLIHDEQEMINLAQHVKWEYQNSPNGAFEAYRPRLNKELEEAFKQRKSIYEFFQDSEKYVVNFEKMTEKDSTGVELKIKRTTASDLDLPSRWSLVSIGQSLFKNVELKPEDDEYKDVEKNARRTAAATINQISKIIRIENPTLWKQYQTKKKSLESVYPGKQVELQLWHGTDGNVETINSINKTGFNRSYCGKNATAFGRGVYFAVNFNYSAQSTYSPPDDQGLKHIYQSRVLVGESTIGKPEYAVPPNKADNTGRYDSVTDRDPNPSMYVIFNDTQAYPEYLIKFS